MSKIKVIPEGFTINERRGPYTNHNGPFYIKEEKINGFMEHLF